MGQLQTGNDLAKAMRVDVHHLIWLAKHANNQYVQLETPKKKGGRRIVYSPTPVLRHAQSWLLSHVLENIEPSMWAKAYGRGSNTLAAVSPHAGNLTVVRIDFADFFGHISNWRVVKAYDLCGLGQEASNIAADLSTLNGYVPQGGITSPAISNVVMKGFDLEMASMLRSWGAVYTRYGDDLIVSFPSTLGHNSMVRLLAVTGTIAEKHGQIINPEKTNVMTGPERKTALGLVFTNEVSMYRKARRTFRAMCHNIDLLDGVLMGAEQSQEYQEQLARVRGMYAYMRLVDPKHATEFLERYGWLENAG